MTPTAISEGFGRATPRHRSASKEFTPSQSITTCAVIASSPARMPTTEPESSLTSSSTGMPQMYSAPAPSASSASHWSKVPRSTE